MTPLHHVGEAIRQFFLLIPLGAVQVLFVALPLALLIWVLRLPKKETVASEDAGWAGNLKVWASVALILQILIYLLL